MLQYLCPVRVDSVTTCQGRASEMVATKQISLFRSPFLLGSNKQAIEVHTQAYELFQDERNTRSHAPKRALNAHVF